MDCRKMAEECWAKIKSNLEDRSVLELGSVDDKTLAELEAEQIDLIEENISEWGSFTASVEAESTHR